ncbi:MAG: glycosyl hydrolase family 18 protein [Sphingomonas sp.]
MVMFLAAACAVSAQARPVLVGYLPAFKGLVSKVATTPIDGYTHINIAFANPDPSGRLVRNGRMTCMEDGAQDHVTVPQLRDAATRLRAKGAKVLLSVAGGILPRCAGDWSALTGAGTRDRLVKELLATVEAAGLDGIDIDIEGELLTRIDRQGNYTPFIAALSNKLKARSKLLTVATASYEGGMIPVGSIPYFDLVMAMSYDAIGPSWGTPGSEHATPAQAEHDVALWLDRGVAPERLVLGVPFYGYGFGSYPPHLDFRDLLTTYPDKALGDDVIGKACAGCDYVSFNSVATIRRKAALARARAGGVMVWEITQDSDTQLLARTIASQLYETSTPN